MKPTDLCKLLTCLLFLVLPAGCGSGPPELRLFELLRLREELKIQEANHLTPSSFEELDRSISHLVDSGLTGKLPRGYPSFVLTTITGTLQIEVELDRGQALLKEISQTRSQLEEERLKIYRAMLSGLQQMAAFSDHPELEPLLTKLQMLLHQRTTFLQAGQYEKALSNWLHGMELFSEYRSRWSRYNAIGSPGALNEKVRRDFQRQLKSLQPEETYIVVDTALNRFSLRQGNQILMEVPCSTGSRRILISSQRRWSFETPRGEFSVEQIVSDPAWRKPDWAFLEEGRPPPVNELQRWERGALGQYALGFGGSYFIHGTLYSRLLGENVTHGCVRLGQEALARLVEQVEVGTKIYIF